MADKQTWKETKQAYLLTLIKHGDLSRGHLDSLIGEAQCMTSDYGNLAAATVEDMGRVAEAYEGDAEQYLEYGKRMHDLLLKVYIYSGADRIVEEVAKLIFEMQDSEMEGKQDESKR